MASSDPLPDDGKMRASLPPAEGAPEGQEAPRRIEVGSDPLDLPTADLERLAKQLKGAPAGAPAGSGTTRSLSAPSALPSSSLSGSVLPHIRDFELLRELGAGGMGRVYLARQRGLDRLVALKTLRASDWTTEQLRRFSHEVRTAARLHHPSIVTVHECDLEGPVPFYTMELVEGPSGRAILQQLEKTDVQSMQLAELIKVLGIAGGSVMRELAGGPGNGPGYYRLVALWIAQVAEALQSLHEMGIWHRDIKPSNLLLSPDGRMKIADFGLARSAEDPELTSPGHLLGSSRYLSPERITGSRMYDHRSDIYALGATFYEFLAFKPARPGDSNEQILAEIASRDPLRPRLVREHVPPELEEICMKALTRNPQERYASAGEIAGELLAWLDGLAVPPGGGQKAHNPLALLTTGALCICIVICAAIGGVSRKALRSDESHSLGIAWGSTSPASCRAKVAPDALHSVAGSTPTTSHAVEQTWAAQSTVQRDGSARVLLVFSEDDGSGGASAPNPDGQAYEKFRELLGDTPGIEVVPFQNPAPASLASEEVLAAAGRSGADYVLVGVSQAVSLREVSPGIANGMDVDHRADWNDGRHNNSTRIRVSQQGAVFEWQAKVMVDLLRVSNGQALRHWSKSSERNVIQVAGAEPVRDMIRQTAATIIGEVASSIDDDWKVRSRSTAPASSD